MSFTCQGTGNSLFWTVQGNFITDGIEQTREISITTNVSVDVLSSVLTIRALPINDGISVGCNIVDQNFIIISKGATLKVQGKSLPLVWTACIFVKYGTVGTAVRS